MSTSKENIDWLPEIPTQWTSKKVKHLFNERIEKGYPNEPLLTATQTRGVIKKDDYETNTVTALKDLHLLKLVKVGDFVISLRSFQGGIEYSYEHGIISPAYTVMEPLNPSSTGYYKYLFKSKYFIDSLSTFVTGIREGQNIDYAKFRMAYLPVPPKQIQINIADFLDRKTEEIKNFIALKERTIELLKERKAAIINQAVTKGLNPNVEMKDSGIDWLRMVPRHWSPIKLKHLLSSIDYGLSESGSSEGDFAYLTMGNIKGGKVSVNGTDFLRSVVDYYLLDYNDILFNRTNSAELVAKTGIFKGQKNDKVTFASYLVRLRVNNENNADYINYYLNSFEFITYARTLFYSPFVRPLWGLS